MKEALACACNAGFDVFNALDIMQVSLGHWPEYVACLKCFHCINVSAARRIRNQSVHPPLCIVPPAEFDRGAEGAQVRHWGWPFAVLSLQLESAKGASNVLCRVRWH